MKTKKISLTKINCANPKIVKKFIGLFDKLDGKRIAVSTHKTADTDAVASSLIMAKFLRDNNISKAEIILQDAPHKEALHVMEYAKESGLYIPTHYLKDVNVSNFDGVLIVDTNSIRLMDKLIKSNLPIIGIIDHHNPERNGDLIQVEPEYYLYNEHSSSATEIISRLTIPFGVFSEKDLKTIATLAIMGILSDTALFKTGRGLTFGAMHKLLGITDLSYEEIRNTLEVTEDLSVRKSILDSMRNVRYHSISVDENEYIIAISTAKEGESLMAEDLVDSEYKADVSFVGRWFEKDMVTGVACRANSKFPIPLTNIINEVTKKLGGRGGGHPKTAGAGIPVEPNVAIEYFLTKTSEMLNELKK